MCGLIPQMCRSTVHPQPGQPEINILKKLPTGNFAPAAFVKGSRSAFEALANRMEFNYRHQDPAVSREWKGWRENIAPQVLLNFIW